MHNDWENQGSPIMNSKTPILEFTVEFRRKMDLVLMDENLAYGQAGRSHIDKPLESRFKEAFDQVAHSDINGDGYVYFEQLRTGDISAFGSVFLEKGFTPGLLWLGELSSKRFKDSGIYDFGMSTGSPESWIYFAAALVGAQWRGKDSNKPYFLEPDGNNYLENWLNTYLFRYTEEQAKLDFPEDL